MKKRNSRFKTKNKTVTKSISKRLDNIILKLQKDLQNKENIEYGRKSQIVTYQYASDALAKVLGGQLK